MLKFSVCLVCMIMEIIYIFNVDIRFAEMRDSHNVFIDYTLDVY